MPRDALPHYPWFDSIIWHMAGLRAKEMEFGITLSAMWLGNNFTFIWGTDRI